jgi:hypothetical protein
VKALSEKYPDGWTKTFYDDSHINYLRVYGHGVPPALGDWKPGQ